MKKIIVFSIFLLSITSAFAQSKFINYFGQTCHDYCEGGFAKSADGGYLLGGTSGLTGSINAYIVKADSNGIFKWGALVGTNETQIINTITQVNDGGYICVGNVSRIYAPGRAEFYVVKLDINGNLLWAKELGSKDSTAIHEDRAYSVIATSDGGCAITGSRQYPPEQQEIIVMKLDALGNVSWLKSIDGSGGEEFASCIIQTNDGGYALAGSTTSFGVTGKDAYFIKLDNAGNIQWTRILGMTSTDDGISLLQDAAGNYIFYSQNTPMGNNVTLTKWDVNGNFIWKSLSIPGSHSAGDKTLVECTNGGYAVSAFTNISGDLRPIIIKFDANGVYQWAKTIYGDIAVGIANAGNGYLTIGGYMTPPLAAGGIGNQDYYLAKVDSNGLSCDSNIPSPYTPLNLTLTIDSGGVVSTPIQTQTSIGFRFSLGIMSRKCGPPLSLSVHVNGTNTSCNGNCNGTAKAIPYGGTSPYTYLWNNGATTQIITDLCAGTYTVTVTDGGGNTSTATHTVANPPPMIINTSAAVSICDSLCTPLSATVSGGAGSGYNYTWMPGNLFGPNVNVCPDSTTTYSVIVSDVAGCIDTAYTTVTLLPSIVINSSAINNTICTGASVTLTADSCSSYLWSTGASTQSIGVNPTVTSTYTLFCTDSGSGCSGTDSITITVDLCTTISSLANDAVISVYPNPSNGSFIFSISEVKNKSKLKIYNILGKCIHTSGITSEKTAVDISGQAAGIYFYKVYSEGQVVANGKLIVK